MSTLPTPRTDALIQWLNNDAKYKAPEQLAEVFEMHMQKVCDLSAQLERELTEAKAERDAAIKRTELLRDHYECKMNGNERASRLEADLSRWRSLAEELAGALERAKCPECDGSGIIQQMNGNTEYVSREMALDAGDPSLEGSVYREPEPEVCQCGFCAMKAEQLARFRDAANPASARTPPGTNERSGDE